MEITLKIEAPGLMEALLAVAEQIQNHNAIIAGNPAPSAPITPIVTEVKKEVTAAPEVKQEVTAAPPATEDKSLETVRAMVISSKTNKEKAKEVMTEMGLKKLTDLNQEQLNELYIKLEEA